MKRVLKRLPAFCVVVGRQANLPTGRSLTSETARESQMDQGSGSGGDLDELHSPGRRGLQSTITILDVVISIAEAVPVVGPSLKGALEALSKVLKMVEQRFDNIDGVAKLTERLRCLVEMLSTCDAPGPLVERLIMQLGKIEVDLYRLLAQQGIRYATVSQYILDCTNEINACVIDFTALTQMRILGSMRLKEQERLACEFVTVMDPFGAPQKVMRIDMTSLEVVRSMIVNRYSFNPSLQAILTEFSNSRLYEFTMDDGSSIQTVTQDILASLDRDATVVMNAVLPERVGHFDRVKCVVCLNIITTDGDSRTICPNCDRRVSAIIDWRTYKNTAIELKQAKTNLSLLRNVTIRVGLPARRLRGGPERDYLQIVHNRVPDVSFDVSSRNGPPHNSTFAIQMKVKGNEAATAVARRINDAKQAAAYKYLREMEWVPEDLYLEHRCSH